MNPRKAKEFIKPTAEELNVKETLVDDVVSFYWKAVREVVSNLEEPSITVDNFGTFKVRRTKIDAIRKKYENYINKFSFDEMTFHQHSIVNMSKERIQKLDSLKEKIDQERERRQEVIKKRKQYESDKDLEK